MDLLKFDKIYVIHCAESKNRYKNIKFQMSNNTKLNDKLEIWWTCYQPNMDIQLNAMLYSNKSWHLYNCNEISLLREFYTIIKQSYLRGFEHIIIFEDDFSLIKEDIFDKFISCLPEDFDIIQLSYLSHEQLYDVNKLLKSNKCWVNMEFGAWSNCGLGLSRKGMKYFIDTIDNEIMAADMPIFESKNKNKYYGKINRSNNDIKHYIPCYPLVYVDGSESEVQKNSKTDIYNFVYPYIKKHLYNIYEDNKIGGN